MAVTAIVDGVHLAPETVESVRRAAGARLCVVSDAIAAAGCGDGTFSLGSAGVEVRDGRATRPDGTLAGSTGGLDRALRLLAEGGAPLADAVHAVSRAPALLAGRPDLGTLAAGRARRPGRARRRAARDPHRGRRCRASRRVTRSAA